MSLWTSKNKQNLYNFLLLIVGIILFSLAQPSILTENGIPLLSYIAFCPVFLLTNRISLKTSWFYGILYGVGCYCFFAYWLATFHPLGITVISGLFGFYAMLTFPLLKLCTVFFDKRDWIAQWIVWCAYEYLKTLGFAGFHYGVTAYSHWQCIPLIQCADVIGVWGLSAIITFPSAWLSKVIRDRNVKSHIISAILWCVVFTAILIYGLVVQKDYSKNNTMTVALIQQNSDPWVGGTPAYKKDLNVLMNLTDKALSDNPNIDFVVWPETAFVPRIDYHYRTRKDRDRFELVDTLLNYINRQNVPIVLGNDHATSGYTGGTYDLLDYNAALLFRPGVNVIPPNPEKYFKMHLVPFTEYFPFEKIFPKLYKMLLNGDTHMWEPGVDPVVFKINELSFGTPICFEDTFGYIGRRFVNNGANCFVNLSNDAWSKSLPCQYQHLSMAVFRSVENRVPTIRATASGQTSIIDPNGRVTGMAEPFTETYLVGDIPIVNNTKKTLYRILGDYVGQLFSILAAFLIIYGLIKFVKERKNNGTKFQSN